jgi:hypothetical protein
VPVRIRASAGCRDLAEGEFAFEDALPTRWIGKPRHDVTVLSAKRTLTWGSLITVGVLVIGFGLFFAVTRLDDADKWGSALGGLAAILGFPIAVYGIVLARRQAVGSQGRQDVENSAAGGGVTQVRGVRGSLRIGRTAPVVDTPSPTVPPDSHSPAGELGGQRVSRTWTAGPVRQVDDIGGDADIDR